MIAFKNSDLVKNTFCLLALRVKFSADDIVFFFFYFSQKKKEKEKMIWHFLQIVCTIRMKCQIMFSGKNKKIITNLSTDE